MSRSYVDVQPFKDRIAQLEAQLDAALKAYAGSTEGKDAAFQAIADAGARKSAPEQLDEAQGAVPAGDPNSPHAIEQRQKEVEALLAEGKDQNIVINPDGTVTAVQVEHHEGEPVGTDPTVSASSTSDTDASSSPAQATSTTDHTSESTEDHGSSPTPTTED